MVRRIRTRKIKRGQILQEAHNEIEMTENINNMSFPGTHELIRLVHTPSQWSTRDDWGKKKEKRSKVTSRLSRRLMFFAQKLRGGCLLTSVLEMEKNGTM